MFLKVPDILEACPSALVMAQQLTHIELERLSYIGPEEFVQAFAKDNLESTYKDLKKTNNLESYVQWFNRLSYLVATQACSVSVSMSDNYNYIRGLANEDKNTRYLFKAKF